MTNVKTMVKSDGNGAYIVDKKLWAVVMAVMTILAGLVVWGGQQADTIVSRKGTGLPSGSNIGGGGGDVFKSDTNVFIWTKTDANSKANVDDPRFTDARVPLAHSHAEGDVTGLTAALAGKSASGHTHVKANITDFAHTHAQSDVTNLTTDLAGKEPTIAAGTTAQYYRGDKTWQTLPAGGGPVFVGTLASDAPTGANVTPVDLTGLVFAYAANSIYVFRWIGNVAPAAATTGCGFQLDVSSAVTQISMGFTHQLANTGTLSGGHSVADDASVGVSSGMPGTSTYPVIGSGVLRTGANTGTAQLRFRSETTAVTTAKAGLTLVVEKIQ